MAGIPPTTGTPLRGSLPGISATTLGLLPWAVTVVGLLLYWSVVAFTGWEDTGIATPLAMAGFGLGLAFLVWAQLTDVFERDHPGDDTVGAPDDEVDSPGDIGG